MHPPGRTAGREVRVRLDTRGREHAGCAARDLDREGHHGAIGIDDADRSAARPENTHVRAPVSRAGVGEVKGSAGRTVPLRDGDERDEFASLDLYRRGLPPDRSQRREDLDLGEFAHGHRGPRDHGVSGLVNLFGIESPGLTSCLAIGDHVAGLLAS